jgi:hypothetical protein
LWIKLRKKTWEENVKIAQKCGKFRKKKIYSYICCLYSFLFLPLYLFVVHFVCLNKWIFVMNYEKRVILA